MMCGGDLYKLSRLLTHSKIKMTERYARLAQKHIMKTVSVARATWRKLEPVKRILERKYKKTKDGRISGSGCIRNLI